MYMYMQWNGNVGHGMGIIYLCKEMLPSFAILSLHCAEHGRLLYSTKVRGFELLKLHGSESGCCNMFETDDIYPVAWGGQEVTWVWNTNTIQGFWLSTLTNLLKHHMLFSFPEHSTLPMIFVKVQNIHRHLQKFCRPMSCPEISQLKKVFFCTSDRLVDGAQSNW